MSSRQIWKDWSPISTNLEVSKIWLCRTFSEWHRNTHLRGFAQQELRNWLVFPMKMGFEGAATQCLKQRVVSITSVYLERHDLLYLKQTFNVEQKGGRRMQCGNNIWGGKVLLLSKSGNVNGVNCTILMRQQSNTWENFSHTGVQCASTSYWKWNNQAHCLVTYCGISNFQIIFCKKLQFNHHFS